MNGGDGSAPQVEHRRSRGVQISWCAARIRAYAHAPRRTPMKHAIKTTGLALAALMLAAGSYAAAGGAAAAHAAPNSRAATMTTSPNAGATAAPATTRSTARAPATTTTASASTTSTTTRSPHHATGQPMVECGEGTATASPGNAASARGSAFNEDGIAGQHYAGNQPQNSRNTASVSQYDSACAHAH